MRTVCDIERVSSLSARSFGTNDIRVIMAHELGPNFGAEHDGEPGTPAGCQWCFIWRLGGGSPRFPMQHRQDAGTDRQASCVLRPSMRHHVAASVGRVSGEGGQPFMLPFTVFSAGNIAAEDAVLTVTLPNSPAFTIDSASSSVGSCDVSGLTVSCALGSMAADTSAQVTVVARSSSAASFSAQATVTARNDRIASNNNRQVAVTIRSGIDAAVSLSTGVSELRWVRPSRYTPTEFIAFDGSAQRGAVAQSQPVVTSATMSGALCTTNRHRV